MFLPGFRRILSRFPIELFVLVVVGLPAMPRGRDGDGPLQVPPTVRAQGPADDAVPAHPQVPHPPRSAEEAHARGALSFSLSH